MYSCEDLRTEISNLLDGDTPPAVRAEIERHLAECRTCQVLVDSTRRTITIVTDAGAFELPSGLSDRLTALIMEKVRADGAS